MSKLTLIDSTDATLVGGPTTSLLSISLFNAEPPVAITCDIHDCASTGDLAAGNKVATIICGQAANDASHIFDGVLFKKGLVVKLDVAGTCNVETE
jgi:hypothetical protein